MRIKLGLVAMISGITLECGGFAPLEAPRTFVDPLAEDSLPRSDPPGSGSMAVASAAVWALPKGGLSPLAGIRSMLVWFICAGDTHVIGDGDAMCKSRLNSGSCLGRLGVFLGVSSVEVVDRIADDTGGVLGTGVLPAAC